MLSSFQGGPAHAVGATSPLVLLVHGFGCNAGHWTRVFDSLSSDVECVALELRGHGHSHWGIPAHYAVEWFSRDISKAIAILDREILLVGHSLGAEAALRAAVDCRAIRGLVLIDLNPDLSPDVAELIRATVASGHFSFKTVEHLVAELEAMFPLAANEVLREVARFSLRNGTSDGSALELRLDPAVTAESSPTWDQARRSERSRVMWSSLRALHSPVRVVRGRVSSVLPAHVASKMVAAATHADQITIDGGHAVMLDNPHGVSMAIRDFASKPPISRSTASSTAADEGTC